MTLLGKDFQLDVSNSIENRNNVSQTKPQYVSRFGRTIKPVIK